MREIEMDEQCMNNICVNSTYCLIGNHTHYMSLIGDNIIKTGERNEWVPTVDHTQYTLKHKQIEIVLIPNTRK